jgi:hypothetical protein
MREELHMIEPLVYTTKGNLPIKDLEHFYSWEETETYIKFIDGYTLNGEVVKESVVVKLKIGLDVNTSLSEL